MQLRPNERAHISATPTASDNHIQHHSVQFGSRSLLSHSLSATSLHCLLLSLLSRPLLRLLLHIAALQGT